MFNGQARWFIVYIHHILLIQSEELGKSLREFYRAKHLMVVCDRQTALLLVDWVIQ